MTRPPTSGSGRARSLAQELREWSDADLAALLLARPDLLTPFPRNLADLVCRACERTSVQRAVDSLDTPTLQVLQILVALPEPVRIEHVTRHWGAPAQEPLDKLSALALVRGDPEDLICVRAARDLFGPYPAGLGPPLAVALGNRSPRRLARILERLGLEPAPDPSTALQRLSEYLNNPQTVNYLLESAPDGARQILERLAWGPPRGSLPAASRAVDLAQDDDPGTAGGPVEWLLGTGLLAPSDAGHVVLPREVALVLRGGVVFRDPNPCEPSLVPLPRPTDRVDSTAADTAAEAVRLVEDICESWGKLPPPVLRSGGLGVRDVRRTAVALQATQETALLAIELAYITGLLADDGGITPVWAPTPAYDRWRSSGTGRQWAALASAWLRTTRCPHLIAGSSSRASGPNASSFPNSRSRPGAGVSTPGAGTGTKHALRQPLGDGLDRVGAPRLRRTVLCLLLAARPPGETAGALKTDQLCQWLDWAEPLRAGPGRNALVEATVDQATFLGLLGMGALAAHAIPLLTGTTDPNSRPIQDTSQASAEPKTPATPAPQICAKPAPRTCSENDTGPLHRAPSQGEQAAALALHATLPDPVEHVLLQADLTAVVPGPPSLDLNALLSGMADVESRGGATTYRFSERSLHRALDTGQAACELLASLRERSVTGVPQPLEYLIMDAARRHGTVRVGPAGCYVQAEDEALLTQVMSDERAAALGLRRLAPTVLVAQAKAETVLATLRRIALAPVAEGPGGEMVMHKPERHRTPPRPAPAPLRGLPEPADRGTVLTAVRTLRSVENESTTASDPDRTVSG